MTTKKYVLLNNTDLYITVMIDGTERTIHFGGGLQNSMVNRKGWFRTSENAVMAAIESHPQYGKMFVCLQQTPTKRVPEKKEEVTTIDHPEIKSIQEARDFIMGLGLEGITLEKVSNKIKLMDVAKTLGHTFTSVK